MYFEIGSLRAIFPCSTSINIDVATIGLVIDAIQKTSSFFIGLFVSRFAFPTNIYFGAGADAGRVSGRLRHNARFVILVPRSLDPAGRGR